MKFVDPDGNQTTTFVLTDNESGLLQCGPGSGGGGAANSINDYVGIGLLASVAGLSIPLSRKYGSTSEKNETVSPEKKEALTKKMQAEIEGIKAKDRGNKPTEQYALVTTEDGYYPNVRTGGQDYLKKGEVWKYGQTSNPKQRYSEADLNNLKLEKVTQFVGSKEECLIREKIQIYGYVIKNGHLPSGNKIFR